MRYPFGEMNDDLPEEEAAGISNDTPPSFARLKSQSQTSVSLGSCTRFL